MALVVSVGQHDLHRRGQNAGRNVSGIARHHDQLVIGVIERGERGQVLAQAFIVALDRNDDGGRRLIIAGPGKAARYIIGAFALTAQREDSEQDGGRNEEPVPEHQSYFLPGP